MCRTDFYFLIKKKVLKGLKYDESADVYSFSILSWEVCTRKKPYDNIDPFKLAMEVINGIRPVIPSEVHPLLSKIIKDCWNNDPTKRPSFSWIEDQLLSI